MKRRSVSSILASAAKVARAEARLIATPQPPEGSSQRRSQTAPQGQESVTPHVRPEQPIISDAQSESETEPQASEPNEKESVNLELSKSPEAASWQCPRLEKLLPRSLQDDRGMMQAWAKGRQLSKVAQSVSLQGPWPGEATVTSRSCDEPRSVDLARCRCTCPSIHAFCAHLLAATVAAEESGDAEACGRMALLCHMRHLARGRPRRAEVAAAVSSGALAGLGSLAANEAALCRWALMALLALCRRPSSSVVSSSALCYQLADQAQQIQTASQAAALVESLIQELGASLPCASLTLAAAAATSERLLLDASADGEEKAERHRRLAEPFT
ncbi:unnamed protein product [Symbiodinium natans]|uniref:SWIM-type domain-containing protein n=1 Tax=Symbiodinium natans TaxID=878477 RepID=A0A812IP23_9DINO|nr:unnamed protein product [Symbiodinium natans]